MMIVVSSSVFAQTPTPTPTPKQKAPSTLHKPETNFFKDIASDQKAIWTSPFHIGKSDWKWLGPFLGGTAALIATDKETSSWVSRGGSLPGISRDVSWNGGIYAAAGISGGMYLIGRSTHHDRLQETGRLAMEALADSQIVTQVAKLAFGRQRPNEGDSEGRFFKGGRSFFSGHASASWSVATIVACEYSDHPLAVWGSYGLATAVSLSRYTGRKHFLSDIFVGAGVGYGIGRYVCGKRKTVYTDDDTVTIKEPRWRVAPYVSSATGTRGGSFIWSF
ncbi:MAG TPA: phosphatase PAP2 family protein [Pyrinomonadaceae bacterium]|nr:phosphatase PAP2 family protein [Pyrinomonadaceae bacterium]